MLFTLLFFIVPSSQEMVFAEDGSDTERLSEKHDESRYDLMTYADNSWYEWVDKTGTSAVSSIKNFLWKINVVITQITLMIIYQMFSLDIIKLAKDSVMEIASGTAGSLITNLGMFAFAIACFGIVVRSYIQQNWQAFFKIVSLVVISMALLFSISSQKFNYVDLAHDISVSIENAVMKVNPSMTDSTNFEIAEGDDNIGEQVAIEVENKAFNALLYRPYLLLQYGTTDEETINAEGSLNGEKTRINEYLSANPATGDGMDLRQDIAEREFNDLNNENIFAGNAFEVSAYIMATIFSTIIQAIVFFFLALMRIMLQFAFLFLLLLVPFMLFLSIFPTFEGLIGQYLKGSFMVVIFKALTVFLVLVSSSFITLSYEMTNMSDDIFYRIFIQSIFAIAIIFMYMKRQFLIDMLNGASPSLAGMGAGEGMGRKSVGRFQKGKEYTKSGAKKTWNGTKKGGKIARKSVGGSGKLSKSLVQKSSSMYDKAGQYASAKANNLSNRIGGRMGQAKNYVNQVQNGDIPNYENPYQTEDHRSGMNNAPQEQSNNNVTPINRTNEKSMRNPHVAKKNLKDSSQLKADSSNKSSTNHQQETKQNKSQKQTSASGRKPNKKQSSQSSNLKINQSNQKKSLSIKRTNQNVNESGRNPYQQKAMQQQQPQQSVKQTVQQDVKPKNRDHVKSNNNIRLNREGIINKRSLLHDDDR